MKKIVVAVFFFLFVSAVLATNGEEAVVTMSVPVFSTTVYKKILVLPFVASGAAMEPDEAAAQQFADNLKQMGFLPLDISLVMQFLDENDITIKKVFKVENLERLRKHFGFDAIVKGTLFYRNKPASLSVGTNHTMTNNIMWYDNQVKIEGGGPDVNSEEIRFYTPQGQPLITMSCQKLYMADMTDEMSMALEKVLSAKDATSDLMVK